MVTDSRFLFLDSRFKRVTVTMDELRAHIIYMRPLGHQGSTSNLSLVRIIPFLFGVRKNHMGDMEKNMMLRVESPKRWIS